MMIFRRVGDLICENISWHISQKKYMVVRGRMNHLEPYLNPPVKCICHKRSC